MSSTSTAEKGHLPFHELIEECSNMLARMDTLQLNALIERFSAEIDSRQTLNYLVDGPSLLTYLISRHVVRPDNLSALIAMAEVADRSDLKQIIAHYCPSSVVSSHPKDMSILIDHAFAQVSEGIQNDWRNLARQLTLAEFDIANIQASTSNDQQLAASEMLDLFRRTRSQHHRDLVRELVTALRAIKRFSLAAKVDELLVNAVPPAQYA